MPENVATTYSNSQTIYLGKGVGKEEKGCWG